MVLVFDIGGMSTKVALINEHNDQIAKRDLISYPNFINGLDLLTLIKAKIVQLSKIYDLKAICLSSCGLINPKTGEISGLSAVKNYNVVNFKRDLAEFRLPIFVENDAKSAALAELKFGSAQNYANGAFVVLGTGIGGAVFFNHKIHKGRNLLAGEFGYFFDHWLDQQYINASLTASSKTIGEYYEKLTQKKLSTEKVFTLVNEDVDAQKAIDYVIDNLVKVLLSIIFTIDPDVIVIGGAISQNQEFIDLVKTRTENWYQKLTLTPHFEIKAAQFSNDANLFGAYSLFKSK